MKQIIEEIQQRIHDADLILVGIGKELKTDKEEIYLEENKEQIIKQNQGNEKERLKKFYKRCFSVYEKISGNKTNQALINLANMLQGKNYFVISTNVDECLHLSGFRYIVTPCGRENLFQCSQNCSNITWENRAYLEKFFLKTEKGKFVSEIKKEMEDFFIKELPKCPKCGEVADFNMIYLNKQDLYCEHYLSEWERYKKWLSGTLNKKLLLLEFGTDFTYPQLIRWPFERTALLNQKAFLIRVHKNLSNIPKELEGRAKAIAVDSNELLQTI